MFHDIDGSEESAEAEYDGLLAASGSSAATSVSAFNRIVGSPLLSNVRRVVFSKVETAIQLHAVLAMPCAVIEMGMADGAAAYMQQLLLQKLPLHARALSSGNPSVASVLKPGTRSIIELGAMAAGNYVVDITCDSSSSCPPSETFQFSDVLLHVLDRGSPRSPEVAAAWKGIVQGGLLSISFPPGYDRSCTSDASSAVLQTPGITSWSAFYNPPAARGVARVRWHVDPGSLRVLSLAVPTPDTIDAGRPAIWLVPEFDRPNMRLFRIAWAQLMRVPLDLMSDAVSQPQPPVHALLSAGVRFKVLVQRVGDLVLLASGIPHMVLTPPGFTKVARSLALADVVSNYQLLLSRWRSDICWFSDDDVVSIRVSFCESIGSFLTCICCWCDQDKLKCIANTPSQLQCIVTLYAKVLRDDERMTRLFGSSWRVLLDSR